MSGTKIKQINKNSKTKYANNIKYTEHHLINASDV